VNTGSPPINETGGSATLDGSDNRNIICLFNPGEFDKAVKACRRGTLELRGTVTDT
jgi:hypothetical protein